MLRRFALLSLLLAAIAPAFAADALSLGDLAVAVRDTDFIAVTKSVTAGLASSDPAIRALAARLANVRRFNGLDDQIRQVLATETSAEAAREEIRALVELGGAPEIDAALAASARFNHRLDGTVATAIARASIPEVLNIYFAKLEPLKVLGDDGNFFRIAFWGRQQLIPTAAAILLAHRDVAGWAELLDAMADSEADLPPDLVRAALAGGNRQIMTATLNYLEQRGTASTYRAEIAALTSDEAETSFAIEIARRTAGETPRSDPRYVDYLKTNESVYLVSNSDTRALLTKPEEDAFATIAGKKPLAGAAPPKTPAANPFRPGYGMPSVLPAGVADAVLVATKSGSGFCVGVAPSTVDAAGRVIGFSSNELHGSTACRAAVEALSELSLVTNDRFDSPSSMYDVLLVRAEGSALSLDEPPVPPMISEIHYPQRIGGRVRAPLLTHRVDPAITRDALWKARPNAATSLVVLQAIVTRDGGVRNVRFTRPSTNADFNSACALAMTQWRFKPAMRDGVPVDVLFEVTMYFKSS